MESNLISCIVPVFNGERYIGEVIESIIAQTYRPLQIIVADDGSCDGTRAVAKGYGEQVTYLWQPNGGALAARNLGLSAASGEYIAFLDADDLWHPEKLTLQMGRFNGRSELDICITHIQMFWTKDLSNEEAYYENHPRARPLPGYVTTTLLARRDIFSRVGQFNTELWFGDATDWFIRAIEHGAVIELLPDVLTYHRMYPFNLTRRRSEASREEFLQIVKASLDRRRKDGRSSSDPYRLPDSKLHQKGGL
jgi:glycosyltransferase involved in cell wall biosynthesis